jgi:hypothetical protein
MLACAPLNNNGVSGDFVIGLDAESKYLVRIPVSELGSGSGGGNNVTSFDLNLTNISTATVTQLQHGFLRVLDAYVLNATGQKVLLEIVISLPSQSVSFHSNNPLTGKLVIFGTNNI